MGGFNGLQGFLGIGSPSGSSKIPVDASKQWRPPQWNKPAMVSIMVPAGGTAGTAFNTNTEVPVDNAGVGLFQVNSTARFPTSYVFDAVLALEHEQSLVKTNHPVQTGASVSSHAYIEPATLVLYVLMSDVAAQYTAVNQTSSPYVQTWAGNKSKSVSAYQQMLTLQAARVPLIVTTRLRTYYNMLILRVSPREDDKTITGARFRLEFGQIFIANTQVTAVSVRPNDTQSTGLGAVNTQPPSATTQAQFGVPAASVTNTLDSAQNTVKVTAVNVPGAGSFSSAVQQFGASMSELVHF